MMVENSPQRIDPFASLDGVQIYRSSHELLPRLSCLNSMDGPCQMARTETEIQLFGFPTTLAPSALPDGLVKSFGRDIETLVSSRVSARPACLVRRPWGRHAAITTLAIALKGCENSPQRESGQGTGGSWLGGQLCKQGAQ